MKAKPIAFECIGCTRTIRVSRTLAGVEGVCPRCGLPAVVPTTESLEAEIAAVLPQLAPSQRVRATCERFLSVALGVAPPTDPWDRSHRVELRQRLVFLGMGLTSALLVGAMLAVALP